MKRAILFTFSVVICLSSLATYAQQEATSDLYKEIYRMDSLLFQAVHTCDTAAYGNFFSTDLEFYQDNGGLSDYSREIAFNRGRCRSGTQIRRVLVPHSLKVYKRLWCYRRRPAQLLF